jgi:uncharacterized membrane protein
MKKSTFLMLFTIAVFFGVCGFLLIFGRLDLFGRVVFSQNDWLMDVTNQVCGYIALAIFAIICVYLTLKPAELRRIVPKKPTSLLMIDHAERIFGERNRRKMEAWIEP